MPSNGGAVYANATLNGWTVNAISGQVLGTSSSNDVYYITAQTPQQTVGAVVPGLQAVAASPDGQTLYGVNTQQNLLVVANAADLTQRQTFQNGFAQANGVTVSGLSRPVAVAVSPNGANVYVASANDKIVALLAELDRQPDLPGGFLRAGDRRPDEPHGLRLRRQLRRSRLRRRQRRGGGIPGQHGQQSAQVSRCATPAIRSISSLGVSRDGSLLYAVSASNDALSVLNTSGLYLGGDVHDRLVDRGEPHGSLRHPRGCQRRRGEPERSVRLRCQRERRDAHGA